MSSEIKDSPQSATRAETPTIKTSPLQYVVNGAKQLWVLLLIVVIWQLVSMARIYPSFMLPSPVMVVAKGIHLIVTGYLFRQIGISMMRQVIGFFLCMLIGLPLGMLLGVSKRARTQLLVPFRMLYPIPGLAWVPLAILWFGIGESSIIFVVFFSAVWPLLFNTIAGLDSISPIHRRAAQALGATRWTMLRRVYFPGALPFILAGLRLAYGTSWRVIVGAEIISASSGLGYMINDARSILSGSELIVGMITIGLIGYMFEKIVFDLAERVTIRRWGMSSAAS